MSKRDAIAGFGAHLRDLRESAQLSAAELCRRCGIHPNSLYLLERGERHPSLRTAVRLADALGVTVDRLARPPYPKK